MEKANNNIPLTKVPSHLKCMQQVNKGGHVPEPPSRYTRLVNGPVVRGHVVFHQQSELGDHLDKSG